MGETTARASVRAAHKDDLRAIMGIYNWAVNQTFATLDDEPLDVEEAEEWWHAHAKRNYILVAEGEDGVVGFARLLPWNRRGLTSTVEDLVYVDPLHHGEGIGRALLGNLIEEATNLGHRTMVAQVAADNAAGRRLHEAMGFTEVGVLHDAAHKFNRWMDIALMERPLRRD